MNNYHEIDADSYDEINYDENDVDIFETGFAEFINTCVKLSYCHECKKLCRLDELVVSHDCILYCKSCSNINDSVEAISDIFCGECHTELLKKAYNGEKKAELNLCNGCHKNYDNMNKYEYKECVVCMDENTDNYMFVGCRHQCICKNCVDDVGDKCPICRTISKPIIVV